MRRGKPDKNHQKIKKALELRGFLVVDVKCIKGFCDLLAIKEYKVFFIEVKDGDKPPSKRRLTDLEMDFKRKIAGRGFYEIITCIKDIDEKIV